MTQVDPLLIADDFLDMISRVDMETGVYSLAPMRVTDDDPNETDDKPF